ncbi:hypothetical protein TNCV_659451 [Trichonephila clavipes]|nr:hypothetical protein TNCV_659451 [Trichonephila clavipes]
MVIPFIISQGIIHKGFLPERTTLNAARGIQIFTRFMKCQRKIQTQYAQQGNWFFVHGNARAHTVNIIGQFLIKKGVVQIEHPPYLQDLNFPDFFLSLRLKLPLKGKKFDNIPDIQRNVTRV